MPDVPALCDSHKEILLKVARAAVEYGLEGGQILAVDVETYPPEIQAVGATFITLRIEEALRGCIGSLRPLRPLVADAAYNAHGAAFRDPRFAALDRDEMATLGIQVSVLSPFEEVRFTSEAELLAQVRPGVDGLFLEAEEQQHKATLLPAVWASLPDAATFVRHLKIKARLPQDYWSETLKIWRYTTESFSEVRNES